MTKQRASYIRGDVHGFRIFKETFLSGIMLAVPLAAASFFILYHITEIYLMKILSGN